jgi:hypothetical protein
MALVLLLALAACGYGQVLVEHSLAVAKAAAAANAAKAKGPAASIATVFDAAGKAMAKAAPKDAVPNVTRASAPAKNAAVAPPAPPPKQDEITAGLDRQDLLARFGKPSMKTSALQGGEVIETYWYMVAGHDTVVVTLRGGKVTGVSSSPN